MFTTVEPSDEAPGDDALAAVRGAWGAAGAANFEAELRDAWATWPTPVVDPDVFERVPGLRVVPPSDWE